MTETYTGGSIKVTFPSNYAENRRGSEVTLNFALPENTTIEDAASACDRVGAEALRVASRLILGQPAQDPAPGTVQEPVKARKPAAKAPILIGEQKVPLGDPLALPAGAATEPASVVSNGAAEPNAASSADVLSLTSDMQVTDSVTDLYSPSPADVAPISEKELMDAIGQRNAIIKNAVAIRGLLGKFITAPQTAKDIPQDKRADFIRELNALQPVAA